MDGEVGRFEIPISCIILDADIYPKKGIGHKRVGMFSENIRDGFEFDPLLYAAKKVIGPRQLTEEDAKVTARRAYKKNPKLSTVEIGRAIGRARRTVDNYIADLRAVNTKKTTRFAFINADWRDFQGKPAREETGKGAIMIDEYLGILKKTGWLLTHIIQAPCLPSASVQGLFQQYRKKVYWVLQAQRS